MAPYPTKVIHELRDHKGPVNDVCFNNSGDYFLSGGRDKLVRLWNTSTGELVHTYGLKTTHREEVLGLTVSPDNGKIASCSAGRSVNTNAENPIFLWDVSTGAVGQRYISHWGQVNAVDFNDEGSVLVSGGFDGILRLWDVKARSLSGECKSPMQVLEHSKHNTIMSVQIKGVKILAGCTDGKIRTYDIRMGQLYEDCIGAPVTSARFSNDDNCILVSTADSTIRLMDRTNGRMLNEFKGHRQSKPHVRIQSTLSNNDAYAISGSEDGKVYVWDVLEGQSVATLEPSGSQANGMVTTVAYHPSDTMPTTMLSAGEQGVIHLWG